MHALNGNRCVNTISVIVTAMYSFRNLVLGVTATEDKTIEWLKRKNLILTHADCSKCGSSTNFVKRKKSYVWRCPKKGCQSELSMRDGSFFSGSHLSLNEIVELTYWWARGSTITTAIHETGHSSKTVVDWFNFHRDVCAQHFIDHPVQIGGIGKTVEIDESKFGKRKYNRGRYREGHWVFGGIERGTSEAFMVEVTDRSASTLLPIIKKFIKPGTTIISDEWRAYSRLTTMGMAHQTVNHSINFVDPVSGAHTQNIECTWSNVKQMMRKKCVMHTREDLFPTYLQEYLWRKKFQSQDLFVTIYDHIKEQYPL